MAEPDRSLQRPSPEALLEAARGETRGRLKLFLGMAPGVGKTFEMLQEAHRRRQGSTDVVVGVVETHGRRETEALLAGLEILPRRQVAYGEHRLGEMDIDALLARQPALAVVDELAHSNAPGSRHPKRYQDVEELLAAGIDVLTTLNIQHLESLNDVVARITHVRVRETVPDRMLDQAAEVELVDITPEELRQRLAEGKVYIADQAARAVEHFFKPGNLAALRELALRRTAERVDAQMRSYMQQHAIAGPWPASERVLVCIDERAGAASLVRAGKRLADRLHAPWTAIHVQTARYRRLSEAERDRIADTLRLAERLGGQALSVPGDRVADELLSFARDTNITQIVVGKAVRSRWFELVHGSVVRDLIARSDGIGVHVIADRAETMPPKRVRTRQPAAAFRVGPYLWATLMVAAAVGLTFAVDRSVGLSNEALVFMAPVMASAMYGGIGPAGLAAVLSTLSYNFFFLEPYYTLTIANPSNVVAFLVFAVLALATSSLAARARSQVLAARASARTTAELYAFSRKLTGIADLEDVLLAAAHQIVSMLRLDVVMLVPQEPGVGSERQHLEVRAAWPPEDRIDDADLAAAQWAWEHRQAAGRDSDTLPGAKRLFLPMRTSRGPVGVLGISRAAPGPLLTPDERRLIDALIDQIAIALERVQLARSVDETRLLAEGERLRAALLASVSHDLKTPLASILGTITALRSFGSLYTEPTRDEMLAAAQEETERLARFVENLLDITRLEAGALRPRREPVDLADVVGSALRRVSRLLGGHEVVTELDDELPLLMLDFTLTEQVIVNLLENAARYTPAGTRLEIAGRLTDGSVLLEVCDEGPGLDPADVGRIFDKFYRGRGGDTSGGTGLGLAVCRGFVEAMGGTISAAVREDRPGSVFRILFPSSIRAALAEEQAHARV
jgi:two-component system sensor histidine kinase KdpD